MQLSTEKWSLLDHALQLSAVTAMDILFQSSASVAPANQTPEQVCSHAEKRALWQTCFARPSRPRPLMIPHDASIVSKPTYAGRFISKAIPRQESFVTKSYRRPCICSMERHVAGSDVCRHCQTNFIALASTGVLEKGAEDKYKVVFLHFTSILSIKVAILSPR